MRVILLMYMEKLALTHLRALEAESIHILREVVAEFAKPVTLYSIGKDSSVMVRLAQEAFYPGKIPFPLLHVDTTYKFQEMVEFRDRFCAEIGATRSLSFYSHSKDAVNSLLLSMLARSASTARPAVRPNADGRRKPRRRWAPQAAGSTRATTRRRRSAARPRTYCRIAPRYERAGTRALPGPAQLGSSNSN